MKYEIEKGIEIPGSKYPFMKMEVGDSFFVESKLNELAKNRNVLSAACYVFGQKTKSKSKFTVRKVEGGLRCWRIK